ncbi:MAG: universal stress protein [Aeromicrobium sp.]
MPRDLATSAGQPRPVVVGLSHDQPALLNAARELALTFDVPLRVVHAYWTSASTADLSRGRDVRAVVRVAAERVLDSARERLGDVDGMDVQYDARFATVARGLEAESAASTLVVIGRHRSAWPGLLRTGHATRHVAMHAACPVIIVPEEESPQGRDVVVAVDVASVSRGAMRFATDLARRWGAPLNVVSVAVADLAGPAREQHHARLDRAVHEWRATGLDMSTHVVPGDARVALRGLSETARIVVVGRPRALAEVPPLGRSAAMPLLSQARCPVAVAP